MRLYCSPADRSDIEYVSPMLCQAHFTLGGCTRTGRYTEDEGLGGGGGGVAAADNTHLKVAEKNYSQHVVAPIIRVILARRKHVCKWEEKRVLIVAHGFPGKVIHEAWCHCALPGLHLRVASRASQIASSSRHTSYVPREYNPFSPAAEYDRSAQLETSSHAFLLPARSRHRAYGRRPAPT